MYLLFLAELNLWLLDMSCDFISVDGGHFGAVPKKDIVNMAAYAKVPGNILVMDDVDSSQAAGHFLGIVGRAWDFGVDTGLLKQTNADCPESYLRDVRRTSGTFCFGTYLRAG
jgi:hypothetical protein